MAGVSETPPRPSHTTLAAGIVIGGSVGVVIGVAEQLTGLHSLETREAVTDFLAEPPGSGLGLDLSGALRLLRLALMVVAGCATAAAVLGFHVLRRSHRARVGLSVLAVPIFFGGLATGGFLTSLVAASALLLWVGPSGLWFRGITPPAPGEATPRPVRWPPEQPPAPATPPAPPQAAQQRPPYAGPAGPPRPGSRRPDSLVWACVLTWAFCSLTLVAMVASVALITTNPDFIVDELRRQDPDLALDDTGLLTVTTYVTAGVAGLWSLAAMVLAALAYRGVRWARPGLLVSAAGAAVICLVAALSSLLTVVPAAVCLVTVGLLNRPEVRGWFTRA